MADVAFNIMKGKACHFAGLPATNDALILTPIETAGIEADAILVDYDEVGTLLAGASNRQTTMGDKTLASVTVTVDDTNNWVVIDAADVTWTGATGNATSAAVVSYDGDTTGGTDANLVPISKHDMVATPAGGDITFAWNSGGIYRAA